MTSADADSTDVREAAAELARQEARQSDRIASAVTAGAFMITAALVIVAGVLAQTGAHPNTVLAGALLGAGVILLITGYALSPPTFRGSK